jgi:hypothetical protein
MKIVLTEAQLNTLVEKFKIDDGERIKLFETDDFLLVVPLTRTASCKYGAGTRWCTTEKDDDQFERHFDMGSLAYLIVKNPDMQEKLANTKFAFFANRPNYIDGNKVGDAAVAATDRSAGAIIYKWYNTIYNVETGSMGYKSEYTTNALLYLLDPHGVSIETWKLFNIFPTSLDFQEVNYENATNMKVVCTFKYDLPELIYTQGNISASSFEYLSDAKVTA